LSSVSAANNVHPISAEDLKKHLQECEFRMTNILYNQRKVNLFDYIMKVVPDEQYLHTLEEAEALRAIRKGLGIYYIIFDLLEAKTGLKQMIDSPAGRDERRFRDTLEFVTTYSLFAMASYISIKMGLVLSVTSRENLPAVKLAEDYFIFSKGKIDTLVTLLCDYVHALNTADESGKKIIIDSIDYLGLSNNFFTHLKNACVANRKKFSDDLLAFVSNTVFKVEGEDISISNFDSQYSTSEQKIEFVKVTPEEIVGNSDSKRGVVRNVDRVALFDPREMLNPISVLGGLSWSVLFDGLPGTGKTSLFKLAMSRLQERGEQTGVPVEFISIDQRIKDEYYGKTGKNLLDRLDKTKQKNKLMLVFFDDVDLLLLSRGDPNMGGSDKDVLNITMQFLDGMFTKPIGNCQVYAATNEPTSTDSALRQRFHQRYLVAGPETWQDYSTLIYTKLKPQLKAGILKVDGETDFMNSKTAAGSENLSAGAAGGVQSGAAQPGMFSEFISKISGGGKKGFNWEDIGRLCIEFKKKDERFTGRPIHSIAENLKEYSADFEVPEEFFSKPEVFLKLSFVDKVNKLKELYKPITAEKVMSELERYFNSEARYKSDAKVSARERILNSMINEYEAKKEFVKLYEGQNQ
jgi:AAA+ superfamily predicted ATPase